MSARATERDLILAEGLDPREPWVGKLRFAGTGNARQRSIAPARPLYVCAVLIYCGNISSLLIQPNKTRFIHITPNSLAVKGRSWREAKWPTSVAKPSYAYQGYDRTNL
jgi:hypothetical protein